MTTSNLRLHPATVIAKPATNIPPVILSSTALVRCKGGSREGSWAGPTLLSSDNVTYPHQHTTSSNHMYPLIRSNPP
jgi:hypothetical protein